MHVLNFKFNHSHVYSDSRLRSSYVSQVLGKSESEITELISHVKYIVLHFLEREQSINHSYLLMYIHVVKNDTSLIFNQAYLKEQ